MELYSLQTLLFFFLLPFFFLLFYHQNSARKHSAKLQSHPLLGNLPQLIQNRHRFLEWITDTLADSPTHTMTVKTPADVGAVITANPSNVEHMLKHNFDNYPRGERSISMLEDFLGHGIFNSDGEHWRWQRKAASFEFNKKSLRNFVMDTVQYEMIQRLLPLLKKSGERNEVIDLQDVLERFGFDNICKVAFGEDPCCLAEEGVSDEMFSNFAKSFGVAGYIIVDRFMHPLPFVWRIKKLLNIGSERKLKESISVVHDFAMKIIQSRKVRFLHQNDDLLSRFASNKDHTDEFLRDIVISFMIAGRETTSSALTWFFWLLSSRPDVERKILEEIKSIRASNQNSGETFSFDELREMHYLHAAISEALRLYPPVPLDTQSCKEDDIMPDGTFVGKGWFVSYSAYAMGRSKHIWGEDCKEYRPERWLENGTFHPESPFHFPVFHAGPRMCLGKEMAYIQMKSIAACVLERFMINVMVEKDTPPEYLLSLTLKMKAGLPIQVRERHDQFI